MVNSENVQLLNGCRCLDLSNEKGFLCGKVLADLGVDVIKIEPPGGDPSRNIGPFYKDIPEPERSLSWFAYNMNKRGITLNLSNEKGQDIFRRLVSTSDFIVESYNPGYMDSLGFGYSVLEKINPHVIMTSITPFGQTGPYAHFKSSDITLIAMGGFMYLNGYPDEPPVRISAPQAYCAGGVHGAMTTVIAYYYRIITGVGQHIDVSIQEAVNHFLSIAPGEWEALKMNARRAGPGFFQARPDPPGPTTPRFHWPCKDGYVSFMYGGGSQQGMVASTKAMIEWMKKEGMAGFLVDYDPNTFNGFTITQAERVEMDKIYINFFKTKTKQELYDVAIEKGIVLCPLNTIQDIVESPQLAARDFFIEVEHPELGEAITYPGYSVKLRDLSPRKAFRAPLIGEHNEKIYEQELGITKEELVMLRKTNVI